MLDRADNSTELEHDKKRMPFNIEHVSITVRLPKPLYDKLDERSGKDKVPKNRIFQIALHEYLKQDQCYFCGEKIPGKANFCHNCGEPVISKECFNSAIAIAGKQKAKELGLPFGEDEYKCTHTYEPRIEIKNQTRRYFLDHVIILPDNRKYTEQQESPLELTIDEIKNQIAKMEDMENREIVIKDSEKTSKKEELITFSKH